MATAKDVAQYLLKLDEQHGGEGISNLKLQKLAYYSQGFFGAIYDKPLFNERVEAWTHGPVIPDLYHEYKCHGSNLISMLRIDQKHHILHLPIQPLLLIK